MQVLVIGAGVVGLAVARAAAVRGHEVIVAEAENAIGTGISSRNSEVIHAGMYYPTGSLRARHCVNGRRLLYAFCASHGVPHRKCGKLIVATDAGETDKIEAIAAQGKINDVEGLEMIDGAGRMRARAAIVLHRGAAIRRRPASSMRTLTCWRCAATSRTPAASSPSTRRSWVRSARTGVARRPSAAATAAEFEFDAVVNCAGLRAQGVAKTIEDYPQDRVPKLVLAKGNYFTFTGKPVFSRLIYPAPVHGGLGVHVTLDLAGRMRFGPDVEWIDREYYPVDPKRADVFYERIRTYFPAMPDGALAPDYSGIRPKLTGPGEPAADFLIDAPPQHGVPGLVQMFGIESPGLTSSLSLAEEVAALISA